MNILDIVILGLIIFFGVKGIFKGSLREISSLAGIVFGLLIGGHYHLQMANLLRDYIPLEKSLPIISFIALFILVFMLFNLSKVFLHSIFRKPFFGRLDRGVGLGLALVKGILVSWLLITVLTFFMPANNPLIVKSKAARLAIVTHQSMSRFISPDLYRTWKNKISKEKETDKIGVIGFLPDKEGYSVFEKIISFFRRGVLGIPEDLAQFDPQYSGSKTYAKTRPFIVFTDRDNISFYRDEACKEKISEKSFSLMDRFFVKGVSADKKALYLVDAKLKRKLEDSRILRQIGWAKVDELLLVDECRKGEDENIAQKAIIIQCSKNIVPLLGGIYLRKGRAKLYSAPNEDSKVLREIKSQTFGYVYKEVLDKENYKWYLIGNRKSFYGIDMSSNVLNKGSYFFGWVKSTYAILWNKREALIPKKGRRVPVHVYRSAIALQQGKSEGILVSDQKTRNPNMRNPLRYIILSRFDFTHEERVSDPEVSYVGLFSLGREGSEVCVLGYVATKDRNYQPIMTVELLLDRSDLSNLIKMLEYLTVEMDKSAAIKEAWKTFVTKETGVGKDASVNGVLTQRLGFSFKDKYGVLSKPISQLTKYDEMRLSTIVHGMAKILKQTKEIRNNPSLWFKNLGVEYTWIPKNLLAVKG